MNVTDVYKLFDPAELSPYIGTRKVVLDEATGIAYGFIFYGEIPEEISSEAKTLLMRCINRSLANLDVLISYRIKKDYDAKAVADVFIGKFLTMSLLQDSSWRTLAREMRLGEASEDEVSQALKEEVPVILGEMKKELIKL